MYAFILNDLNFQYIGRGRISLSQCHSRYTQKTQTEASFTLNVGSFLSFQSIYLLFRGLPSKELHASIHLVDHRIVGSTCGNQGCRTAEDSVGMFGWKKKKKSRALQIFQALKILVYTIFPSMPFCVLPLALGYLLQISPNKLFPFYSVLSTLPCPGYAQYSWPWAHKVNGARKQDDSKVIIK